LTPALKPLFLTLGTQCAAVICCRVSPSQKALTVRLVSSTNLFMPGEELTNRLKKGVMP
jgi:magnesium-transporting ATPase (P-type)